MLCIGLVSTVVYQMQAKKVKDAVLVGKPTSTPPPTTQNETYYLTLSNVQKKKLQELIETDPQAQEAYGDIEAQAELVLKHKPNPVAMIQSSGILKGDEKKTKSLASVKDAEKVYALSFAYTIRGDQRYLKKAKEIVLVWAKKNTASKDPIDQRLLAPMFFGYDLIKDTFTPEEKKLIDTWMISGAHTLIDNINTSPGATSKRNNHQSHLLSVVAMVGFSTNDQELIDYVEDGYKAHIKVNLNPDGSSFDFHQRDALYYHVFTLEPLLTVARISDMNGIDLFGHETSPVASKSASLQKSVDFLMPYATGKKTHAEWVKSTAPFDKKRKEAGDEEFQPGVLFQPKQAYKALELYSYFNPEIIPFVRTLSSTSEKKYPDFLMLYLEVVR